MKANNRRDFLQKVGIGLGVLLTSDMLFAKNKQEITMYLAMEFNNTKAIIELANNPAAREFAAMLPLELEWSDFAQKEKNHLSTQKTASKR